MEEFAIKVDEVSKDFRLPLEKQSTIKSMFVHFYKRNRGYELQHALQNITIEVKKGEFFGIVGRNGSGKSTLLKLLAGIYTPTKGQVHVRGSLTPFIELGVGFNPELTGRENVYLNGALLGFSRRQMRAMYKDIVDFAELDKFMDQKLKNYSSGMQVRLAFSIAIRAQSDILLLDEVLAVGDAAFQAKCFEYFRHLKSQKKTIVFVSHDRAAVEQYCNRAALIDKGKLLAIGDPADIFSMYADITIEQIEQGHGKGRRQSEDKDRWGTGEVEIIDAVVLVDGKKSRSCKPGQMITIKFTCLAKQDVDSPVYGVTMGRAGETPIFVENTALKQLKTNSLKKDEKIEVSFTTKNIFGDGEYLISPAVANSDASVGYDWRNNFLSILLVGQKNKYSYVNPDYDIKINADVNGKSSR